jgi:hypothetical protein
MPYVFYVALFYWVDGTVQVRFYFVNIVLGLIYYP